MRSASQLVSVDQKSSLKREADREKARDPSQSAKLVLVSDGSEDAESDPESAEAVVEVASGSVVVGDGRADRDGSKEHAEKRNSKYCVRRAPRGQHTSRNKQDKDRRPHSASVNVAVDKVERLGSDVDGQVGRLRSSRRWVSKHE